MFQFSYHLNTNSCRVYVCFHEFNKRLNSVTSKMPLPRKPVIENEYTSKFAQHWRHECPQYCDFKGYGVKTADHCCSLSNTTSSYSLHPPYITFFPPLGNIHLSLDYESPQNFLACPPEPKNTNHSSHMLSPTIRLHNCFFPLHLLFFCVLFFSVFVFAFYSCSASGYYFQ